MTEKERREAREKRW